MNIKGFTKGLTKTFLVICLLFFTTAQASNIDVVKNKIIQQSVAMGVDPAIMLSIAKAESGFKHETRSVHGAVGVFQLMPATARRMGLNPYSLDDNIKGGIMYYKSMYQMFGSMQLAIAAYNAGPGNVKRYKAIPPFRETQRYVSTIMANYHYLKAHTDPAVTAYKNSLNKTDVQAEDGSEVVANAPNKAPIPIAEQSQNLKVKDMPIEGDLKVQSVEM